MKKLVDQGLDDHPDDDPERPRVAWPVVTFDDRDGCGDIRIEPSPWRRWAGPEPGWPATAPASARQLRSALACALREVGEDPAVGAVHPIGVPLPVSREYGRMITIERTGPVTVVRLANGGSTPSTSRFSTAHRPACAYRRQRRPGCRRDGRGPGVLGRRGPLPLPAIRN